MIRRLPLLLTLLALQLLPVRPARAQSYEGPVSYEPTPQWFAMELKFGPYKPDVDSELSGASPYQDIFGKKLRVMSQLTGDVQFLKYHGTLGVGGTVGFFQARGKALLEDGVTASGDETTFNIVPLVLQLVYRWDYAAKKWNVPLVPYIRAGIVYCFYWITDGNGDVTRWEEGGDKAHGGVWGYQINLGLAFQLDVLEPSAAKRLDAEIGVNHTYLFAEFVHSSIDDFGGDRIRLGMKYSLLAGLSMEF